MSSLHPLQQYVEFNFIIWCSVFRTDNGPQEASNVLKERSCQGGYDFFSQQTGKSSLQVGDRLIARHTFDRIAYAALRRRASYC